MKKLLLLLSLFVGFSFGEDSDVDKCTNEGYTYGAIPYYDFMDAVNFECLAGFFIKDMVNESCEEAPFNEVSNKFCKQSKSREAKSKYKKKTFKTGLANLYKRMSWDCLKRAKLYKDIDEKMAQETLQDCLTDASINPSYTFQRDINQLILDFIM